MANYMSATRTNYFHVTDPDRFRCIMNRCSGEDRIEVFTQPDELGETAYAFGVAGTFDGIPSTEEDSDDPNQALDRFIEELQTIIRPDDACVITNAGWEKLRYVGGNALIITHDKAFNLNLTECAARKTRELLDDPAWELQT